MRIDEVLPFLLSIRACRRQTSMAVAFTIGDLDWRLGGFWTKAAMRN